MRSKPTRRIAAALGLAVIFTGLSTPPSEAAPVDDLVASLPGMPVAPYLIAATGDSLVNFESYDETDVVTVSTDRGASWDEASENLRNIERTANGTLFYQAPADSTHTNLYTYDLATKSITSKVTFPTYRLEAVGEDYVAYGTDGSEEEEPTQFAAAAVGDPTSAVNLTIPARSPNRLGLLVGAGSRGVAVSRSLTSRAGTGYLDVVSLTGGDAGYASEPLPGLVAATIAGQHVYYVLATSTNLRLCQRSLESAQAWSTPSCLTLKTGDSRTAFGDGTLVAGPSWAGFNLWYGDDVFVGGFIADWTTATPKVIALKASGSVTRVKLPTLVNDLDRPLVIAYTKYTATDQAGYLAKVQANGALTRFAEWPTVAVQPDQLSLSATRMAGVDARGTGTAWLRDLAAPGTEKVLSSTGLDAFVSAGRTAVNSTTGLVLTDQGKQVAKLSALRYLWQLSGPYLLGSAPKATKMTVLAGTKPVAFAADDYPLAIFGSHVAAIDVRVWEVRIYDVASGKPELLRSVELNQDYESADLAMWGDHLAITGYFSDYSTEVKIRDWLDETWLPWPGSAGAQAVGLSDNVALIIRDNQKFELLNPATMESQDLGDSVEWPLPALDGAGRILYATDSELVVHQIPFAGMSQPRALWASAASSFNSFAGETAPWQVSVDATKAIGGGELELRGVDAISGVSVKVPVEASADGSLRIAWDGKIAGAPAPAGTYEWELLGFDDLLDINGVATVNGRVNVTNAKVAYPQATPLLNNLKPATDSVLTVDPGALPSDAEVKIQWYRDTTPIAGAVDATYQVAAGDVGRTIKAKVSFANAKGYLDASKYSRTTATVVKATITPAPVPFLDDTTPTVDQAVTGTIGTWGPDPVSLSYQWY
ncbi:MAG: hypothetical protein IT193_17220, partial [Propionibacteriaceae bacterium]|nr:hypothetical protein [Propionibacteriaceae bacterium]